MSIEENNKLSAVIKIVDFPSRNEVIDYFKTYMKEKTIETDYNIKNKSNEILFIIQDHDVAYNFVETFNKEISNNLLYSNCDCSLTFKTLPRSSSLPKIINNRYKIISSNNLKSSNSKKKLLILKKPLYKYSNINEGSYVQKHWADIKNKGGSINSIEPYIEEHTREYKERINNKKKWIDKKGFNNSVGKASLNNSNFIKNYVRITPSLPPLLYQFRKPEKEKWINKSGFKIY
jgi:hypothetical protein